MNKITFYTVLLPLFWINHTEAQDTISLTNVTVNKVNNALEFVEAIGSNRTITIRGKHYISL